MSRRPNIPPTPLSAWGEPLEEVLPWGVEVWRGGVNSWECDEMGHLNVRFYVAKAMEGLVGLAAVLGMPHAFSPDAAATLIVREQHIRFLAEARPGAPLHMRAGVVEMGESDARLLLVLIHSATGRPAASFQTLVTHVTPRDAQPFPWPARMLEQAAAITGPVPDFAAPRGVDIDPFTSRACAERAEALNLITIGTGALMATDCDVFGRMRPEQFIGRVAEGVGRLVRHTRSAIIETTGTPPERVGGVALEYRMAYLRWPRAGSRVLLRSGVSAVDSHIQHMTHWMLDTETGDAWAVGRAAVAAFDLEARKILAVPPEGLARLQSMVVKGLTL